MHQPPAFGFTDEKKIRAYRSERIRGELRRRDLGVVLVVDPINLRYAIGTRNMQVWTMHNIVRYALSANITETPATFGISVGRWR